MSYLVNRARVCSLTINGVNYTNNLRSWSVSDASANKNGLITTTGSVILGENPAGEDLGDYARTKFKRGAVVILDIEDPETSATIRHPRGYLYVISSGYSVESSSLEVEIGCRLSLAILNNDQSEIIPLVPIPLESERQDIQNCGASFVAAGKCLYQDNQGVLQTVTFFDGDTLNAAAPAEWTSVLDLTAISAQPMLGGSAIPDTLKLSYQIPVGALGTESGKIERTITESEYFIQYPATTFTRVGTGLGNVDGVSSTYTDAGRPSSCGNSPGEPAGNPDLIACNDGYATSEEPTILPATNEVIDETFYNGPGGQTDRSTSYTYGPAVELNGQYFSDLFAYCRYTWATACSPNGSCAFDGMERVLQGYTENTTFYGPAGEVIKTVSDTYENILRAAQPFDWRAGTVDGVPRAFSEIDYINGTTSRNILVGSGTTLVYNKKALTYWQTTQPEGGFYYADGNSLYLSARDSNGVTTRFAEGLQSIIGPSAANPTCTWQGYLPGAVVPRGTNNPYRVTCNYQGGYFSTNSNYEWPTEFFIQKWFTRPNADVLLSDRPSTVVLVSGEVPSGDGPLNIHSNTQTVAISSPNGAFYRSSRTVTENYTEGDANVEYTVTWTSIADKGVGIYRQSLDALNGTRTTQKRTSRTIYAAAQLPDRVSVATANTEEKTSEYPIFASTYVEPPVEAGPYVIEESVPVPFLFPTEEEITEALNVYSDYVIRFIKGDALGYTVGESLRPEIASNWYPGMPFRFVDREKGKILALRMDACEWGVNQEETGVVTNGIWIGTSNGTLNVPSNLTGNSIPSLDEDPPTPPSNVIVDPEVVSETYVYNGPISFVITVYIGTKILIPFNETESIITAIADTYVDVNWTMTCWVSGLVVQPGNLLALTSTGSVPISANGSLLTTGAVIVDANVFPA